MLYWTVVLGKKKKKLYARPAETYTASTGVLDYNTDLVYFRVSQIFKTIIEGINVAVLSAFSASEIASIA